MSWKFGIQDATHQIRGAVSGCEALGDYGVRPIAAYAGVSESQQWPTLRLEVEPSLGVRIYLRDRPPAATNNDPDWFMRSFAVCQRNASGQEDRQAQVPRRAGRVPSGAPRPVVVVRPSPVIAVTRGVSLAGTARVGGSRCVAGACIGFRCGSQACGSAGTAGTRTDTNTVVRAARVRIARTGIRAAGSGVRADGTRRTARRDLIPLRIPVRVVRCLLGG